MVRLLSGISCVVLAGFGVAIHEGSDSERRFSSKKICENTQQKLKEEGVRISIRKVKT